MFKTKAITVNLTATPPSDLATEANAAAATAGFALSSFLTAADDLDRAANQAETVALAAQTDIDNLIGIQLDAEDNAQTWRRAANNLRGLVATDETEQLTLF